MAAEEVFWGSVTLGLADSNPLSTNALLLIYGVNLKLWINQDFKSSGSETEDTGETYLICTPLRNFTGWDPSYTWKELALLFPAQG